MQYHKKRNLRKQTLPKRYCHKKQDDQIFVERYYCWFYDEDLKQNLAPISWEDRKMARFVLKNTLGEDIFKKKKIHIIKGSIAKRRKMEFGKYVIYVDGKLNYIRKFYIPPEFRKTKTSRRNFLRRIYKKPWKKGIEFYQKRTYGR